MKQIYSLSKRKEFDKLDEDEYLDGEYLEEVGDSYAYLIGLFLIYFSMLEQELNLGIANIIHQDWNQTGFIIVEKLTFNNKIELFDKLYLGLVVAILNKRKKLELIKIRKQLTNINSFRNEIVHANWKSISKNGYVRTKIMIDKEEGFVKFKKVKIIRKNIKEKIRETEKLIDQIEEFTEKAFE